MAEGKAPKESKRKREIRDAGQRVVFAGLQMDRKQVAELLAASMELPPLPGVPEPTKEDKADEVNRMLELLKAGNEDGPVTIWVRVGEVVGGKDGEAPDKGEAVERAVDKPLGRKAPGRFRAPTLTHWRGEKRRKPPTAVPLDEEDVD